MSVRFRGYFKRTACSHRPGRGQVGHMYGWLPLGKGFSVESSMISVAAMYTASEMQHDGRAP